MVFAIKKYLDSDFEMTEISIPNALSNQMKMSMAVNSRKIIIDKIIDETVALECIYYLNKLRDLDTKYNPTTGDSHNDTEPIEIYVNSNGGSAFECFLIVDLIEQMKKDGYEIITINAGKAYSAGMAIALCGSTRKCFKRARYMFHDVSSGSLGKSQELAEQLEETAIIRNTYYDIITAYSDIKPETIKDWQERKLDKFFSSEEMLELKGVDVIL